MCEAAGSRPANLVVAEDTAGLLTRAQDGVTFVSLSANGVAPVKTK